MNYELLAISERKPAGSTGDFAFLLTIEGDIVQCFGVDMPSWRTVYDIFAASDAERCGELLEGNRVDVQLQLMTLCDGRSMAVSMRCYGDGFLLLQCFPAQRWRDVVESESYTRQFGYAMLENINEQGALLKFFREAVHCADIGQFLALFFNTLSELGLASVVSVHHQNYSEVLRHDGLLPTACERRLIDACRECDQKILCTGARGLFRGRFMSFVVKNMPGDNEIAGRFRDHLAILLDGADAIVDRILRNCAEAGRKQSALLSALGNNERMLSLLDQEFDRQNRSIMGAINTIISKMYSEFCYLHLTDTEEDKLIAIINEGIAPLTDVVASTVTLQRIIRASIDQLSRALAIDGPARAGHLETMP